MAKKMTKAAALKALERSHEDVEVGDQSFRIYELSVQTFEEAELYKKKNKIKDDDYTALLFTYALYDTSDNKIFQPSDYKSIDFKNKSAGKTALLVNAFRRINHLSEEPLKN